MGVVGDMGAWDFLPLEWAQIALRGESLYVCLWDTWGVIAMDHVSELARYARDVPYTLQPPKSPSVEVTGIRFRASSRDPNDEGMTGQEFERTKVQAIQGLVDMHPVGPQATPAVLTVRWSGPMDLREDGYRTHRRTWHGIIDFSDGKDRQGQFQAPFEETFYPGRYTLKILINGDEGGSGSFTLTGRTTVIEAALQNDVPLLKTLLEQGANPNTPSIDKSGNKRFPLPFAASMHPDHGPLIELLLSHGADPDVENYPGGTALAWVLDAAEPDSARVLLKHRASLTADCRVENQIGSPLRGALASYLSNEPKDRVKAQKAKDIFFMLLEHGARLRAQEEPIVADKRLHGWLPQDFILEVLKRNDQAVLEARDLTDPLLQGVVISRLLDRARAKTAAATSKADYQAALALCDQAKIRAQVWGIESRCPLIYYNTGLLYGQLSEIEAAKDNFRRYLALAPGAQDAEAIRKSFGL